MTTTEPTTDLAPNVILALARVMEDLPGIGRDMTSPQGYQYRGVEQITQHAQPLFAKHGVVLAPHGVTWRETVNLTINNRPWVDEKLIVHYRCYGPGGVEDYIDIEVPSTGRDNADKGCQKAMTAAYKYALLQTLCISDAKDDTDSHPANEADAFDPEAETSPATRERMTAIREACHALREKGEEVTEQSDDGEVSVLGVPILIRDAEGALIAGITNREAEALLTKLQAKLEPAPQEEETPQPAPQEPAAAPEEPQEPVGYPDPPCLPDAAGEAPETHEERVARMTAHVAALTLPEVRADLTDRGLPLDGTPAKVRQRLTAALVEAQ